MDRKEVYYAIDTERVYQDNETANPDRLDMVEDFNLGQSILAMEHLLAEARRIWYNDNPKDKFQDTMNMIRKVCGVCVKMGEKYGMPIRVIK